MKPKVLIVGCLALLLLCTCAVAGAGAVESYAEPGAMVGEWGDMEVAPTDVINLTAPDEDESGVQRIPDNSYALVHPVFTNSLESTPSVDNPKWTGNFNDDPIQIIVARAIFGEARGESEQGRLAVGWVIRNRAENPMWWGSGYHGVILKDKQFSCFNSNDPNFEKIKDPASHGEDIWIECYEIAGQVISGDKSEDITLNSDHYYSTSISPPSWAVGQEAIVQFGVHKFYRLQLKAPTPNSESSNVDVALIIDSSGSMSWNDPKDDRLEAAKMFIDIINFNPAGISGADQIAVVNFDSSVKVQKGLTRVGGNETVLKSAIDKIGSSGATNIGGGLLVGYNELNSVAANPEHKKAAILLTDGEHNTGTHPLSVVPDYKAKGWPIYTIGFTTEADVKILKDISEETGGEYYTSLKSDTLKDIYTRISQSVTGAVQVKTRNGKITVGETISGSLPVDSSIMAFNLALFWPGSDLDLVLYYPDGDKVALNQSNPNGTDDPDISYISQDRYEIYKVQNPQPGAWHYDIVGIDVTGQEENYTLTLSASTTIKLDAHTDKLDYDMGEGVKITANFTEDDIGIVNAQATASIVLSDLLQGTLVLSDSGGGVYEGTFYATQSGHYSVLVEVQRGLDVTRQKQIEFDVSMKSVPEPIANFTADRTRGIAPLPVQFTDIPAGGTPAIWEWDFGDGNTAAVQSPTYVHNYTVAGTYTVKLTTTNAGGSNVSTKVNYITIMSPAPTDIFSDSSGDDSSISTGSDLAGRDGASFSFTGLPVSAITIESKADISRALIIAGQIRSLPGSITPPKSETYQYLEITLHRLESADFDEAVISFNVPVGYLSAMGMGTTDVALMRYTDGQWVHLETTLVKEEGGRAYYEAVTPGFSVFAITLEKDGATIAAPEAEPTPAVTVGEEEVGEVNGEETDVVEPEVSPTTTVTPADSAATPTPKETPVIYAPIGLIVAGLFALAFRCRRQS